MAMFVRLACDRLGDTTFAARAGLAFRDATSLTAYISKHSRTLRKAIENSQKYYRIVDPDYRYSLRVSDNVASLEVYCVTPYFEKFHRYSEFLLCSGLTRLRILADVEFYPLELRFVHDVKPATRAAFEKAVGATTKFGVERMELLLAPSTIDLPIPTFDPYLRTHLMEYGERLLSERPEEDPELRARVERIIFAGLPGRIGTADEVAASLGMSKRTFARRLSEDGLSFRQIVDELRSDLAQTYLKGGFSLSEISYVLDYSDQAAFSTAFKRWTGESPKSYLRRLH